MPLGKLLILIGLLLVCAGVFLSLGGKIPPLGRLPGDLHMESKNFSFYFPLTTCILVSLLLSLIIWIFRR
ncbi:hypothetical protein DBW_2673 [Desulfuromonas sp. DDH964]|uniref:DUF2905 domain-containing protein n=1 Tax=Desulfuromonas sp. DDH964 TaxID=1823759 RepID=UPI00078C6048|nr:DUF2905 domain-containing protein [Desulfuromonas sp. DDH964]AMV72997.1 hypothetical protein DBW_2673 [Desulfuromonas sp. DDH964]